MTGDAPSLGSSSDGFGVPFLAMDTFLNNRDPPLARLTLTHFF